MSFLAAVADVRRTADRLRADRDQVAREVDALLDGSWRGPAATAYAEGWADWKRSAAVVLDGLATMVRDQDFPISSAARYVSRARSTTCALAW